MSNKQAIVQPAEAGSVPTVSSPAGSLTLSQQVSQDLVDWFYNHVPASLRSPEEIAAQIVANILSLPDDADVFEVSGSLDSASAWAWKPITVVGISGVEPSTFGGIFVVLDIIDKDTGEATVMATGSPTILAQLRWLAERQRFPFDCQVAPIARGPKDGRNPPLYLRHVGWRG